MAKRIGKFKVNKEVATAHNADTAKSSPDTLSVSGNTTISGDIEGTDNSSLWVGKLTATTLAVSASKGNIQATGSGFITGRRPAYAASNTAAIDVTMDTGNYLPNAVIGLDLGTASKTVQYVLPSGEAGLKYTWLVNDTAGSGTTLTISSSTADVMGHIVCDDNVQRISGSTIATATNGLQFAATKAIKGTRVDAVNDGTIWQITGYALCDEADVSSF